MPLTSDFTPQETKPQCIQVYFRKAMVLNAVGLSGPGARALFDDGQWQEREKPFFLSFMSIGKTTDERLEELKLFIKLLRVKLYGFTAQIGLQINKSCPNVAVHDEDTVKEAKESLYIAQAADVPLMLKYNALLTVQDAHEIAKDPNCDALCVSNTIPWRAHPDIDWDGLFGVQESPLVHLGGGGLSGAPLMPLVRRWISAYQTPLITTQKPINAGGGILTPTDVDIVKEVGAASIFIGSVAILRGWRVQSIIRRAYEVFGYTRR